MGRNGAGKSTLLRHAAGLLAPTRGRVARGGRVALLLQNPGDYLLARARRATRRRAAALAGAASPRSPSRHPRDLSGGERQRLALAIVLDGGEPPRRGLPRRADARHGPRRQGELAARLRAAAPRRRRGRSSPPTTPSSPRAFAERVVLLADGRGRSPTAPARRGARRRLVLRDRDRARARRRGRRADARAGRRRCCGPGDAWSSMSWEARHVRAAASSCSRWPRLRLVRAHAAVGARARARGHAGRAGRARAGSRSRRCPNVKPTTDIVLLAGYALGGAPGFAVGAVAALASNLFFGQGPWTPWQMAAWGLVRLSAARCSARLGAGAAAAAPAGAGLRGGRARLRRDPRRLPVDAHGAAHPRLVPGGVGHVACPINLAHAVGQRRLLPRFGPVLSARAAALPRAASTMRWEQPGGGGGARAGARPRGGRHARRPAPPRPPRRSSARSPTC